MFKYANEAGGQNNISEESLVNKENEDVLVRE